MVYGAESSVMDNTERLPIDVAQYEEIKQAIPNTATSASAQ